MHRPLRRRRRIASSLKTVEAEYADWLDAGSAVSTIDSGLTQRLAGRSRSTWASQLRGLTAELARTFASAGPADIARRRRAGMAGHA